MTARVCPNHGGGFDCTPFCPTCAGDQEYDDTPNIFGDLPPSRFRFGLSHFVGNPYAQCDCGAVFVMFTDDGDLVHDCPIDRPATCHDCGDTIPDGGGIDDWGVIVCRECWANN